MENILTILNKIFFLILLISAGVFAKKIKLISTEGEKDLSRLLVDFFWPAMIFASITGNLTADDILSNISLPVLAIITAVTGFAIGMIFLKITGFKDDRKKIFLYHTTINNFIYMVLPFAMSMIPGKGVGLLFIHNLGYLLVLWTLGISILKGSIGLKGCLKNLLSPGLISTMIAIIVVISGMNKYIPKMLHTTLSTIGKPTLAVAMIITGARIYKLGRHALKFDKWNILLGFLRLVLIPLILFIFALILKVYFNVSREVLIIFSLVNIMPVSVNSVSLAMRFKSSPELAAQGVVFTHLFSVVTIVLNLLLIEKFLI